MGRNSHEHPGRTSSNGWVERGESDVIDWIFRRIADATKIDEGHLWDSVGAEPMQVVHYREGEEYGSHKDYGQHTLPERFLTFLIYLNDQDSPAAGGETHFPYAKLKAHCGKGNVVAFYNMLEDGNVDVSSLHAALKVLKGEKWIANVWIWDPVFSPR